jgi:ribosomal protein S18 acetylase RimI-like enzyme
MRQFVAPVANAARKGADHAKRLDNDPMSVGTMFLELDNPFWSSLQTRHRAIAQQLGDVARFPAEYAPFLGVAHAGVDVHEAVEALVAPGESVYLLGVAPHLVPDGWRLETFPELAQMVCTTQLQEVPGPEIVALDTRHRDDVLALTALVYPHYFRPRTIELGRYFGIYEDGRLAAMIGERLGTDGLTEMSAICTHPDYAGRGYARRLTAWLTNDTLAQGHTPFLHVSHANTRAKGLYDAMGYKLRADIGFWALQRA